MDYKKHLPVIVFLLTVQFFIADIYAFFYLRHAYKECLSLYEPGSSFYMKGDYSPRAEKESPPEYKFVTVEEKNDNISETYYTVSGEKIVVKYSGEGEWKSTSYVETGSNYFLFLPLCGFSLFILAIIKKAVRTGSFFSWQLSQYRNDTVETLCLLYGVPLFSSWILFGLIGRFD